MRVSRTPLPGTSASIRIAAVCNLCYRLRTFCFGWRESVVTLSSMSAAMNDQIRVCIRCSPLLLIVLMGCVSNRVAQRNSSAKPEQFIARATDGRLNSLREETRSDDPKPPPKPRKENSHGDTSRSDSCSSRNGDRDGGPVAQMFGSMALGILSAPFTIPCAAIGDEYDQVGMFPAYPYDLDESAMFVDGEHEGTGRGWMANLQLISADTWDGDVKRLSGRLQLDTLSRIGLDIESNHWSERLSGGGHDGLWTGDANVVFRFAQSEKWQFRAGAGVNWLADDLGTELGFNLTYGADWFPRKPWTVSSVFDVGRLGDAGLFHNRTTIGAMVGRSEIFCGYDYFQLGSTSFHGPVAGIGLRF